MSLDHTPATWPIRILIINPNTSESMTTALRAPIESLAYNHSSYTFHTAPSGVSSINSPADASLSTTHVLPSLLTMLAQHDGFLVACYSPHPLVAALKARTTKPVVGIFEASIASAVQLLNYRAPHQAARDREIERGTLHPAAGMERERKREQGQEVGERDGGGSGTLARFGIVTTGAMWKSVLESAIRSSGPEMLGPERAGALLGGVETLGMHAGELHGSQQVDELVRAAVRALRDVGVIILGCAGMVGMEKWVQEELDRIGKGGQVQVVDGIKAGIGILQGLLRGGS